MKSEAERTGNFYLGEIPIINGIAVGSDKGIPEVVNESSEAKGYYHAIAEKVLGNQNKMFTNKVEIKT